MKLVVVGVNHKTAPIALREKLAFASDDMPTALAQLSGITAASVIVSTCNRTEIYALAKEPNHISPNNQTSNQANQVNRINDAWLTQTLNAIYQWLADYKRHITHKFKPLFVQPQKYPSHDPLDTSQCWARFDDIGRTADIGAD